MVFSWLDAGEAARVGVALADDFVMQTAGGPSGNRQGATRGARGDEFPKFMQRFLQRVDRDARPLKLNIFKRAKLANSFKWRLLEKGLEPQLVDELTQALVLRLTTAGGGAAPAGGTAVAQTRRASARDAQALHVRAGEALARRDYGAARECYQDLVNYAPRDALARHGLGTVLAEMGRYDEAEAELRRAIELKPALAEAHLNLSGVLQSKGRYEDAEAPVRRALKLKPAYLDARISLGMNHLFLGRLPEARDSYEKALRVAPRNARALVGMGQIDALEGRFAEAEAAYRKAVEVEPRAPHAWAALAWLRRMTPADTEWIERAEEIADNGLVALDEATLRFAIGKYYDDVGDFKRAFRSYQRANELHKLRADPYDRKGYEGFIDDLVRVRSAESIAAAAATGSRSERPVFVLGMPRSGTSLVEQIIASHPQAHGAGELNFWQIVVRRHEGDLRQGLLTESLRRKLAEDYLEVLAGHSADALRVIDKAPVNATYLGLINAVFPRARVVYLQRDPIDTCLSCYFQQFPPALNWSMDLGDLAHFYRESHRLTTHWRRVLPPGTILDVPYEELTADQETWTRRILEFVGLPWDERCLEFYKTARAVNTASVWQVRQKIYRNSVQRWRNYEKFIGPLRSLADLPP